MSNTILFPCNMYAVIIARSLKWDNCAIANTNSWYNNSCKQHTDTDTQTDTDIDTDTHRHTNTHTHVHIVVCSFCCTALCIQ